MRNTDFIRSNLKSILAWPLIALLLGAALWGFTLHKLNEGATSAKETAFQRASSLTSAYVAQLTESLEQIKQITLLVKRDWQNSDGRIALEEYSRDEIISTEVFRVAVANEDGKIISSTVPEAKGVNLEDKAWFKQHRNDPSGKLRFHGQDIGAVTGRPVIRFSRRLEHADGSFAGVAWVVVNPSFLTTFYGGNHLGEGEFISLRITDGPVLATKVGEDSSASTFYKKHPNFPGEEGIIVEPPSEFVDNESRIVAWQRLESYPLTALSALTERAVYGTYFIAAADARELAMAGTFLLLTLAIVGSYYSARLAWRRQQDKETRSIFRLAIDGAREGFYIIRPLYGKSGELKDFRVVDCNERGAAVMGLTREMLNGKKYSELYSGSQLKAEFDLFRRGLESGFYEDEIRVTPESLVKAGWIQRKLVRSGSGLAMTIRDISEVKAHERTLFDIANTDALTGLPNRHWLNTFLPSAVEHAKQFHVGLAVLFIDLDNFKNINDTLGHAAGDELLKEAARRIKSQVRGTDHVVRLGGDEFTVILEQTQNTDDVSHVARLIIEALRKPFVLNKTGGNHVLASIGISLFPQDGADDETLMKHADIAMYSAKTAGKGRYHFYHPRLSDYIILRVSKEEALRKAIEQDEFVIYYQPRVNALTGKLTSNEALVRWMDPERGLVAPSEFIPIAEETGMILNLGDKVIAKVCAQLAIWKAQGHPMVPVSINVSALQFNDGKVKESLTSCLKHYGVDPRLIGLELTESSMVADDPVVPEQLHALRSLGVKLLIDDFGTGYSSLSQLQQLEVDILKVDQAFTLQLDERDERQAFYKAIVSMGTALNICIVAEGVETVEQLRILQALACDEVQGDLISKPLPAEEIPKLLRKGFLFPDAVTQR